MKKTKEKPFLELGRNKARLLYQIKKRKKHISLWGREIGERPGKACGRKRFARVGALKWRSRAKEAELTADMGTGGKHLVGRKKEGAREALAKTGYLPPRGNG